MAPASLQMQGLPARSRGSTRIPSSRWQRGQMRQQFAAKTKVFVMLDARADQMEP